MVLHLMGFSFTVFSLKALKMGYFNKRQSFLGFMRFGLLGLLLFLQFNLISFSKEPVQGNPPKTIVDYASILPDKFAPDYPKARRAVSLKNQSVTIDIPNGYIEFQGDTFQLEMALFKKSSGDYLIAVNNRSTVGDILSFLEYHQDHWWDVTHVYYPDMPKVSPSFEHLMTFTLPRHGKTIEVSEEKNNEVHHLYDMTWTGQNFKRINYPVKASHH